VVVVVVLVVAAERAVVVTEVARTVARVVMWAVSSGQAGSTPPAVERGDWMTWSRGRRRAACVGEGERSCRIGASAAP
jgi:hypothetical protein